jgi:hypothetical protein
MTDDPNCPRYLQYPETIMHIHKDCEAATRLWNKVIKEEYWSKFFSLRLELEIGLLSSLLHRCSLEG